jgi:hypothetical protein
VHRRNRVQQLKVVDIIGGGEPDSAAITMERPGAREYDVVFLEREELIERALQLTDQLDQPAREEFAERFLSRLRAFAGERVWSTCGLPKD